MVPFASIPTMFFETFVIGLTGFCQTFVSANDISSNKSGEAGLTDYSTKMEQMSINFEKDFHNNLVLFEFYPVIHEPYPYFLYGE